LMSDAKANGPGAAATAHRAEIAAFGKPTSSHNPELPLGTIWEVPHAGELIRFSVCEFKGRRYVELRRFYRSAGEWKPGRQGCTMPLWALPELHAANGTYLAENARSGTPGEP
jgi:hypothetical protein